MFDLRYGSDRAGLETGNVAVILDMLQSIHAYALDDVVMDEFATTIAKAIAQLRQLQQIAYETMLEIEAELSQGPSPCHLKLVSDVSS